MSPAEPRLPARAWAALYATATLTSLAIGPSGPRYWDSFGYVIQSIDGRVGGLMLGRPTFILAGHAALRSALFLGLPLRASEPLLRAMWMLVASMSAPLLATVCLRTGLSLRAALVAGAFVALSPAVAHTGRAVLTDGPSMALVLLATSLALRSPARARTWVTASIALGVAAGVREAALAHALTLLAVWWTTPRTQRWRGALPTLGIVCALTLAVPLVWVMAHQPGYVAGVIDWSRSMRAERGAHPYGLRDAAMAVVWIVVCGPVALLLGARTWISAAQRRTSMHRALWIALPSALQLASLTTYQDIAFSPRYLLAAWPLAVALPAAVMWDQLAVRVRRAALALTVGTALVAIPVVHRGEATLREGLASLPRRLDALGPDAAVVTGQLCPAVVYERELRRRMNVHPPVLWVQVCPGWRWPTNLTERLDGLRAEGRSVVLDLRPGSWVGPRQQHARELAEAYLRSRGGDGVIVWR